MDSFQLVTFATVTQIIILPTPGCCSCSEYEDFEKEASCGDDGYLIHMGLRNCKKFSSPEIKSHFTSEGTKFLQCTKDCLIHHLKTFFKRTPLNCEEIGDSGFESHVNCYLQCGFCNICKSEKLAFLKSYDYLDFFTRRSFSPIFQILRACGPLSCFLPF
ncbi:hypothetical protein KIN20_036182 [Parelaphostrongylus tenuis]|uniref:Uncharacterized protein n=1 Tax=Parelaphostrongylus tenuis TaxID=148309 RepID=A0AAD5WLG8_PARTN|nr:hypothetical protein KIN20_036182 [Parelaphostrongylus tenuis]